MDILSIIGQLPFRLAKTMPHIPHEYTVRSPGTEELYVTLFNATTTDGVYEYYKGRRKKYLYPGEGRKYWAMTSNIHASRVLNRMKIEDT